MPLSEVDDELTRAIFKLQPTNSKAVKADMITVATKLGTVIAEEMGIVFGVMYDGWTHGTMHFVAVYGLYVVGGQLRKPSLPRPRWTKEAKMLTPISHFSQRVGGL
ncbi:hypothetical protein PC129_g13388 [Phytophthora cactorum]|uniref:Uncharacterized protein n=1 Tax=Phytophthora cactorum TaxID=29920 RepID=A0A329RP38_9STRA|nr:hypothetical protein Pcac1_g5300 [Phytophthora cactorum]KAG2815243.1 hypothetical protein PC112_g13964 [Phytophthora cactorum]KAG2816928.1 hypothetical protein PC111_g12930 [Phytophthora cactorum]KAG2853269.1 hypothetical protein PC113_g14302 [Phytophthora cactorum]KAG2896171.1 hypothetical protein PC114_g15208 [Phytophthora cactorum]